MIRRTLALIALALASLGALGALGGCGRQGATPPAGSGPSPTVTSGSGTELPSVVRLSRTGGLAGVNQSITIDRDGSWSYGSKGGPAQTGSLDQTQLAALRDLVVAPAFLTELRQVETDANCADGFNYAITVGSDSAAWEDCGAAPRPNLNKAIDLITLATPF